MVTPCGAERGPWARSTITRSCYSCGNSDPHSSPIGFPWWLSSKEFTCSAGATRDGGSIPGLGRSPGGRHDNPLQYSCVETPWTRGSWWATVHRVAKSWTCLKRLSTHAHQPCWMCLNVTWSLKWLISKPNVEKHRSRSHIKVVPVRRKDGEIPVFPEVLPRVRAGLGLLNPLNKFPAVFFLCECRWRRFSSWDWLLAKTHRFQLLPSVPKCWLHENPPGLVKKSQGVRGRDLASLSLQTASSLLLLPHLALPLVPVRSPSTGRRALTLVSLTCRDQVHIPCSQVPLCKGCQICSSFSIASPGTKFRVLPSPPLDTPGSPSPPHCWKH